MTKVELLRIATIVCCLVGATRGVQPVQASDFTSGVAQQLQLDLGAPAPDGSIISNFNGKYQLSHEAYDQNAFGIATTTPSIQIQTANSPLGDTSVITSGTIMVRVSTVNGQIHAGDWITSSATPGVGMKATQAGYVLGIANGEPVTGDLVGEQKVPVTLSFKLGYGPNAPSSGTLGQRLLALVNLNLASALRNPIQIAKFSLALLITGVCLFLGIFNFGHGVVKGIEAAGRNPLAQKQIFVAMIFNLILGIAIVTAGAVTTLYILKMS